MSATWCRCRCPFRSAPPSAQLQNRKSTRSSKLHDWFHSFGNLTSTCPNFCEQWPISRRRRWPLQRARMRIDPPRMRSPPTRRVIGSVCWRVTRRETHPWRGGVARSSRGFVTWNARCRLYWWAPPRPPLTASEGCSTNIRRSPRTHPNLPLGKRSWLA